MTNNDYFLKAMNPYLKVINQIDQIQKDQKSLNDFLKMENELKKVQATLMQMQHMEDLMNPKVDAVSLLLRKDTQERKPEVSMGFNRERKGLNYVPRRVKVKGFVG
jgi:hypothetical protein